MVRRFAIVAMILAPVAFAQSIGGTGGIFSSSSSAGSVPVKYVHAGDALIWRTDGDGDGSNFGLNVNDTVFAGDPTRPDRVYQWGYNPDFATATEPQLIWQLESYYHDGAAPRMELFIQYTSADKGTVVRPLWFFIDRTTKAVQQAFLKGDTVGFYSSAGVDYGGFNSNGLYAKQLWVFQNATTAVAQKDSGGTYRSLLSLVATNLLWVGQSGAIAGIEMRNAVNYTQQAVTISDSGGAGAAAYTLQPTHSYVRLTCSDADGCDVTMSETSAVAGREVRIVNVGANVCNFADSAGVSELAGAFVMGQYDALTLLYEDRWIELSRSDN
jgi:hypothetical protein